jgi:hypothetical protein
MTRALSALLNTPGAWSAGKAGLITIEPVLDAGPLTRAVLQAKR